MAAGVHHAGILGGVGQAGGFHNRQSIHVGPQSDAAVRTAPADRGHHAVAADSGGVAHAHLVQLFADEGSGLAFMGRKLGIGVQMLAPAGQSFGEEGVHRPILPPTPAKRQPATRQIPPSRRRILLRSLGHRHNLRRNVATGGCENVIVRKATGRRHALFCHWGKLS
jgi:hypothetical protein